MPNTKEQMLAVITQHKLSTPTSDTKTMPEGLRGEVRNFVKTYVGDYRKQLRNVKDIKKREFLDKHKDTLLTQISNNSDIKKKINDFKKTQILFMEAYKKINDDQKMTIINPLYDVSESRRPTPKISELWLNIELDKKFNETYGKGFFMLTELLDAFEKKIEEAIVFATISEVYKVVKEYDKFEPYMKKLGELKIK